MARALTTKQQAFIEAYLTHWNATRAAIDAKYPTRAARQVGSENLSKPDIQAAIAARLTELKMSADEVLTRLADHARGDASDFVTVSASPLHDLTGRPLLDEDDNEIVRYFPSLDLEKARQRGKLHLIKSVRYTAHGPAVELYDAQAALALLGKHHGLFVEKIDMSRQEIEAFLDRLKHNLSADEYARIVALAAGGRAPGE